MVKTVKIKTEYITLQQLLKLVNIASSGGEAKILIKQLDIKVNDVNENRRGRKLYSGDVVIVNGKKIFIQ